MTRLEDIPKQFQLHYHSDFATVIRVCLVRLGAVKRSPNPYFAVEERNVQNQIVRYLGKRPTNPCARIMVERADGSCWGIYLNNFESYEIIDEVQAEREWAL